MENKIKMNEKLKVFLMLNLSCLFMAVGIYFFKVPNGFDIGGVSGISIIISKLSGAITPSWLMFVINIALLGIGFLILGRSFGVRTTYCTIIYSVELVILEYLFPLEKPLTDEPFLELIFAVLLTAIGSAIMFNNAASSGGTDIIAMILKKYTSIDIGKCLLISDSVIVAFSFYVFGIKTGLFCVLGFFFKTTVIDSVIESFNQCKYFTIITTKDEDISNFILNTLHHGVTSVEATGVYSHANKRMLHTVCKRYEAARLKIKVKELDPQAFMMITNSSEIIGRGFRGL